MDRIDPVLFKKIVFFTGAGMSRESGVPTYRGEDGIWEQYNYQDYACQKAFERNPEKVHEFHEIRRKAMLDCKPHMGHEILANLEAQHDGVWVVTQNIDGMHQRAGNKRVVELHGSLFRVRCPIHGVSEDVGGPYLRTTCETCGNHLRPDITWFGDMLDEEVVEKAIFLISDCDLFISIGTSAVVWPAAGFPEYARTNKAYTIEINPEDTGFSRIYHRVIREKAVSALTALFDH